MIDVGGKPLLWHVMKIYAAQGFDLDGQTITAPTGSPYEDPAIGAKPTVTAAPLYVGGVSQASGDGN